MALAVFAGIRVRDLAAARRCASAARRDVEARALAQQLSCGAVASRARRQCLNVAREAASVAA
jgi:hypothetical protein